jgi:hypothetical protein
MFGGDAPVQQQIDDLRSQMHFDASSARYSCILIVKPFSWSAQMRFP